MAESKTDTSTTSKSAQSAPSGQSEPAQEGRQVVFRDPATGEQLDTVTALHGDDGEDPYEAGFRGVKPNDEPGTVENSIKQAK